MLARIINEVRHFREKTWNIFTTDLPLTIRIFLIFFSLQLAGLDVSSEEEAENSEDEFREPQSATAPDQATTTDAAHLTASAATPPRPPSGRKITSSASSSSLNHHQQTRSPLEPQSSWRRGPWSNFIDGAKRVIDSIIDVGDESDTSPERWKTSHPSSQQHPGATTAGFPTVRRGSSFPTSEVDLTILGDTTPPSLLQGRVAPETDATTATTTSENSPSLPALPELSEPSSLMEEHQIRGLIAEIPLRYRQSPWKLVYSTQRDGISMQTMLRSARGKAPTVLVVRDMGKAIFGAFCSEPWKVSTRYYGTGETFVFQLHPREVVWHWWWQKAAQQQNDFFMWGSREAVAVGGAGGYALWLDSELSSGISRNSITFGNDSLSTSEEFRIGAVELWWLE